MSREARSIRAAVLAAVLLVSMGARQQSANFIVETPDPALAARISQAAEQYRRDLAVAWLGKAMPNWSQPCTMTVQVGPNLGAGGATTFMFDRNEVYGWRMSIQGSAERILDSVLPHEITHMVFASHFRQPLPRWADEGGATSVEHVSERAKHHGMLDQFLRTGRGIAFNRMFVMREYPPDIMPLYAQGYALAEYLIQQRGRREYVAFLDDGLRDDQWARAIQRHYGYATAGALQKTWLAWIQQGWPQIKPRQETPADAPQAELVAVAAQRERPEPNLIYHLPQQSPSYAPGSVIPAQSVAKIGPPRVKTAQGLADAAPSRPAVSLPPSGWHPAGQQAPSTAAIDVAEAEAAAPPAAAEPVRTQVSHPQPIERSRQIILQWAER